MLSSLLKYIFLFVVPTLAYKYVTQVAYTLGTGCTQHVPWNSDPNIPYYNQTWELEICSWTAVYHCDQNTMMVSADFYVARSKPHDFICDDDINYFSTW